MSTLPIVSSNCDLLHSNKSECHRAAVNASMLVVASIVLSRLRQAKLILPTDPRLDTAVVSALVAATVVKQQLLLPTALLCYFVVGNNAAATYFQLRLIFALLLCCRFVFFGVYYSDYCTNGHVTQRATTARCNNCSLYVQCAVRARSFSIRCCYILSLYVAFVRSYTIFICVHLVCLLVHTFGCVFGAQARICKCQTRRVASFKCENANDIDSWVGC